ncbi:MAG: methionyl-tRNA formyltransferase [Chloroflexi bacterium]|nr:methionyl-tRNA formyltransferase [Chloroflexota bacterium]
MRVVLIGQAAFGEAVYRRLLEQGEEVVGVFYEREGDALHTLAQGQGVPAYPTPELRSREFFQTYRALKPELNVMAFVTVIVPERVLNLPSRGTIQYHPSLLPLHRGRSAINWAIINGDTETGVTIFWPDRGIDTGLLLLQKRAPISPTDTVSSLYRNYLFPQGVEGLGEAVALVSQGRAPKMVQDEVRSTYEPPCEGELANIQWFRPAEQVYNHIRGCDPQPGAAATLRQELVRLTDVELGQRTGPGIYGEVVAVEEGGIRVALNGGSLLVRRIRREGERPMLAAEFARTVGLKVGERLGGWSLASLHPQ